MPIGAFRLNSISRVIPAEGPAGAWTVANASYDSKSFSITQETQLQAFYFKDDGTKVYVLGITNDRVYQYSLSTAWDISTTSYDTVSFLVNQDSAPRGLFFKPDGTAFYTVGSGTDRVYQYSLSTAWDMSTASYASKFISVSSQEANPQEVFFKPDGTAFYVVGLNNDTVYQYSLSTAWDVTTASYASKSFGINAQESNPTSLNFKDDGTRMWVQGSTNNTIYQYNLSTAWDVSTASYASISYAPGNGSPRSVFFKPDGNALWTISISPSAIYQYTLS